MSIDKFFKKAEKLKVDYKEEDLIEMFKDYHMTVLDKHEPIEGKHIVRRVIEKELGIDVVGFMGLYVKYVESLATNFDYDKFRKWQSE